jgi:hypothetical protein
MKIITLCGLIFLSITRYSGRLKKCMQRKLPESHLGSLVIPVKLISVISQVNNEYPFKSRCMR